MASVEPVLVFKFAFNIAIFTKVKTIVSIVISCLCRWQYVTNNTLVISHKKNVVFDTPGLQAIT